MELGNIFTPATLLPACGWDVFMLQVGLYKKESDKTIASRI